MSRRRGGYRRYMSTRQRRERYQRRQRLFVTVCALIALGAAAASPGARLRLALTAREAYAGVQAVFAGREEATQEVTLPARRVWALQLGVYDSGESAQQEQQRLTGEGVPCILWQRERMRIVCAAALSEKDLRGAQTFGLETYTIEDGMEEVRLRLGAAQREIEEISALILLPDALFEMLLGNEEEQPLSDIIARAREIASPAITAHEENALYTQLAQSVVNWCALIERASQEWGDGLARQYGALTMCTLCRELRTELLAQAGV